MSASTQAPRKLKGEHSYGLHHAEGVLRGNGVMEIELCNSGDGRDPRSRAGLVKLNESTAVVCLSRQCELGRTISSQENGAPPAPRSCQAWRTHRWDVQPWDGVARAAAPVGRDKLATEAAISEHVLCRSRSASQGLPWAVVTYVLALGPIYPPRLCN